MSVEIVKLFKHPPNNYFNNVATIFMEYNWLITFKWTEIYTHDIISSVPFDWHCFLKGLSSIELQKIMTDMDSRMLPESCPESFKTFLERCKELSIRLSWPAFNVTVDPTVRVHRTSEKKISEVKHVAEFIDNLLRENHGTELPVIIDIGCGLGYLTKKLSSKGFQLVGIDARGDLCVRAKSSKDSIKFVEMVVNDSEDCLHSMLSILSPDQKAVLIGLHSCGDLLSHIISLYTKSPRFIGMFCVTCCYHKMDKVLFPRSSKFREIAERKGLMFNPVVLRVGTQRTPESWCQGLTNSNLDAHTKSGAFRGILQEVIESSKLAWKKPRSKMKLQGEYSGYIDQVIEGFNEEDRFKAQKLLEEQVQKRSPFTSLVRSLKILQTIIQPVMESAIVYDHLNYLKELGFDGCVIQCFSQIVSPRNLLVISMKNEEIKRKP